MTVEQAVLGLIISYLERGMKRVPVWQVEQAHEAHQLSGRARIRGLRNKGLVEYKYCADDNTYEIMSSLSDLHEAWQKVGGKGIVGAQGTVEVQDGSKRRQILPPVATKSRPPEEKIDIEEMRKFRENL